MSRQVIASLVSILVGVLTILGVTVPQDKAALLQQHAETILGSVIALYGIAMWIYRKITKTPLVGWFKKEQAGPLMGVCLAVAVAIALGGCVATPRAPSGPLETIEAAELTAQQLGTSILTLTCTKFQQGKCIEPGKAFMPDKGLAYFDQVQSARAGLRAAVVIGAEGLGQCLGEMRTQAACIAAAQALLREMERRVIEAKGGV